MIENTLQRIADALERIAVRMESETAVEKPVVKKAKPAAKPAAAPAPEPTPEPEPAPEPEPEAIEGEVVPPAPDMTLDDLRRKLAPLGPEKGRALMGQFGVSRVSEVPQERWGELLAAAGVE